MEAHWHLWERDFFEGLPQAWEEFLARSARLGVKRQEFVFFEGDPGGAAFYLESGTIKIFRTSAVGKEPIFFLRQRGEMFGLAEVATGNERKANAQALTASVIHRIEDGEFKTLLANHHPLAWRVIEVLGRRLRYLGEQIENLMVCDVATRLLKIFVYLSFPEMIKPRPLNQPLTVPFRLTQDQLASMAGSCQQTVSETLKRLQEDGLIQVLGKAITILNPAEVLSRV